jgi:hypothetical protein
VEQMINVKDQLKSIGLGLLSLCIILIASQFINYFIVLSGYFLILNLIQIYKKQWTIYNFLKSIAVFIILILSIDLFKWLGFKGLIIEALLFGIIIIGSRWKQYIEVKQHMESMIWGKPLKEYREKKEKIPKIKIKI